MSMPEQRAATIAEILDDGSATGAALQQAFREAVAKHRRAGVPMVFREDGEIVEAPPEELPEPGRS